MKPTLVHHLLEHQTQCQPDSLLVIDGDQEASYGDVESGANRIAHALLAEGIRPGDRVGLLAVNSREYIEAYYGILKSGGIVVSLNASADWHSHGDLLGRCQARGLICGGRLGCRAAGLDQLDNLGFVLVSEADLHGKLEECDCRVLDAGQILPKMDDHPPSVLLSKNGRAAIVYTSGSTGEPKGVTLRHANLLANSASIINYLDLGPADRSFVVLPFHYVYGKSLLNTHVAVGGSLVIENMFLFPQKALDHLERCEATGFAGVPSTFAILLNRSNLAKRQLPSLRYVTQAGGAMTPDVQRRLIDALPGKQIFIMYGATEASARLSYLAPDDLSRKIGSIGKAIPGVELRIIQADGTEAEVGEVGELVATGTNLMEGYWNDVEATAQVLDEKGYHTGDLATRDEEGFLTIVGRSREMIKSGANRISPKEIEEALAEHPQLDEVAVVGIPDKMLGESIHACVSPRDGMKPEPQALLAWCKKRLPDHKIPSTICIVRELKRNSAGKIDKRALCEEPISKEGKANAATLAALIKEQY